MLQTARPTLGDYTVNGRQLLIMSLYGLLLGICGAFGAKLLLILIGLVTHFAYNGTLGTNLVQPNPRHWGPIAIAIPVVGGVLVGLIARFFTDKIRGHGIPEAIQSILERQSVVQARVAFWKPIASAIAIGTGNPFGAEGPIIMTGGAVGSLFAQFLHLSSFERRTLLVAGAAAGMSATFGAPIASVLLAVELLLFEWKPRSFVPVAVASCTAELIRIWLINPLPPFIVTSHITPGSTALGWAIVIGLGGGVLSLLMTRLVYFTEDLYQKLPVHWMWWPAIGGAVVGIGGWLAPAALGVGYPTIDGILNGSIPFTLILVIVCVKIGIWVASLSSGTSGGVLAPLLMIGAGFGTFMGAYIPGDHHATSIWAIVGMASLIGGTMRSPFMGTLFALETTRAWGLAPEIFTGCMVATAFTVIFVPRSILTEKLARRGVHVQREYSIDPLEFISIGSAMTPGKPAKNAATPILHAGERLRSAAEKLAADKSQTFIVVDNDGSPVGTFGMDNLLNAWRESSLAERHRTRIRLPHRVWHRRPV